MAEHNKVRITYSPSTKNEVPHWIDIFCDRRGLSRSELSKDTGIAQSTMSSWARRNMPTSSVKHSHLEKLRQGDVTLLEVVAELQECEAKQLSMLAKFEEVEDG